mmetsp:Transcript_83007/g.268572  ORF Transcript_83007/g.268572 Transcript_83007/m.268572 type:complete len:204 (-) Transcript_83007:1908-2519(-)
MKTAHHQQIQPIGLHMHMHCHTRNHSRCGRARIACTPSRAQANVQPGAGGQMALTTQERPAAGPRLDAVTVSSRSGFAEASRGGIACPTPRPSGPPPPGSMPRPRRSGRRPGRGAPPRPAPGRRPPAAAPPGRWQPCGARSGSPGRRRSPALRGRRWPAPPCPRAGCARGCSGPAVATNDVAVPGRPPPQPALPAPRRPPSST